MRKVYVLYGWTPENGSYVSGIYTSKRKAERNKSILEEYPKHKEEGRIYHIETEVLL